MTGSARTGALHALLVTGGYTLLFCWLFSRLFLDHLYLSESDLYDWFLPIFLSPAVRWCSYIFAGLPAFADTSDTVQYPLRFLFGPLLGSWNAYVVSAYVIASSLTYAYVFSMTRSRLAAAFSGVAFGLSEAMVERQAHINIAHAIAWFPLVVLSVDRVAHGAGRRWVAIGAAALACCFLSGHPQPFLYAAVAAAVYGAAALWALRPERAVTLQLAGMFVLGGLLTAVKSLPFLEASRQVTRTVVNFDAFIAQSHTPIQMLGVLFPAITHNGREAPLYAGIAVLMLAAIGLITAGRTWRVVTLAGVGTVALLVGAGDSTPIAALLYYIPPFDRFRVAARMLFLFAFAAAVLSGFGIAALQQRRASWRTVWASVFGVLAAAALGAGLLATTPDGIAFEPPARTAPNLPLWPLSMWVQLAIAIVSAAIVLSLARTRRFAVTACLLIAFVAADLVHSLPYAISVYGLQPIAIRSRDLQPPVHAMRLAQEVVPTHERLLAVGGTTRDANVPGGFARLWRIPIAGGYSPIVLGRLSRLAGMGGAGDVRAEVLAPDDRSLDLLAVRDIIVREDDFKDSDTFERSGLTWNDEALEFPVGRSDCGYRHQRARSVVLPDNVAVSEIALVAYLRCSEEVTQGSTVGSIEVGRPGESVFTYPLRAGIEIADRALSDETVRARARHGAVETFDDPELESNAYLIRVRLPSPTQGATLTFRGEGTGGWIVIERMTLVDAGGRSLPQNLAQLFLSQRERWRLVNEFRSSRTTDRDSDEAAEGEQGYRVFENLHRRPRAWVVPATATLQENDIEHAVRQGTLPDGSAFDPSRIALLAHDEGDVPPAGQGTSSARVTGIDDGRITVEVDSQGGGFLILSEMYYPGWQARIDGQINPVRRADLALQGVAVPRGQHTVVFELVSTTLRIGSFISLAAGVFTMFLIGRRVV